MRISQARRTGTSAASRSGRTSGTTGGGFQLPGTRGSVHRPEVSGAAPVSTIDAILALQSVEEPGERRRRAVERGGRILDILERLKIGLLSGRVSASDLASLKKAIERRQVLEDDPELNDLLAQIELRAHVELAKLKDDAA